MLSFKEFLEEQVTKQQLKKLEIRLDNIWSSLGMDVEFTRHFVDRVNDERNTPSITLKEIEKIFVDTFSKYGNKLKNMKHNDVEAVLNDIQTLLNIPFVLQWNRKKGELEMISKTIMRKKNFKTSNKKFVV